jgi:pyruvate/2-oxoglutarate dehydrogenase complex dihydrolipoamide dehydrogenase (E3) component/uncharacterized membrane protein YdjX (TVP38/TMEM64 family)
MRRVENKNTLKFAVFLLLVVGLLAAGHHFNLQQRFNPDRIRTMIDNAGPWGFIVFAAFYLISSLVPFPATLLSAVSGALWGEYLGTVITVMSATVACCVPFLISRLLGRGLIGAILKKNHTAHRCDRFAGKNGFTAVLLMRLIPIFPWDVVNYVTGLCGIKFRDYFMASLIGTIPASFTYNLIGSSLGGPIDKTKIILIIAFVLIIALTVILAKRKRIDTVEDTGNSERQIMAEYERVEVSPMDKFNTELIENVRPPDWSNPMPAKKYDLVVIGAGTAGLVTAAGAAGLGGKVALIERNLLGGDCLNVGCVPSKSFIRSSRAIAEIAGSAKYGISETGSAAVDFASVMERVRAIRAKVSHHDSAKRFRDLGVDVFLGQAEFSSTDTITVGGKKLRFRKAVIATGARAVTPDIEGIKDAGFLTNETVFNLTEQPKRLAVIGGGPIGCELAQAFGRLGTQVTLFHRDEHILNREDADAAAIVQERFKREAIQLNLGCAPTRVEMRGQEKVIHYVYEGKESAVVVDEILAGAGRAPNVDGLNLESVGVQYDKREGVKVNDHLQTTNPRIYAAGDICVKWKFTHAADAAARIVIQNALFLGRKKLSDLTMPWCTYTDPEIAHVGLYEREARASGIEVDTFKVEWSDVDRAVTDGEEEGFIKIHIRKGTDRIVGATVVAAHAGEMISEISVAMAGKIGLGALSRVIHPYPTQTEAIKKVADAFSRTRLTPAVKKLLSSWLAWQRK